MLDFTTLYTHLDAATDKLSTTLVGLLSEERARQQAKAPAAAKQAVPKEPAPARPPRASTAGVEKTPTAPQRVKPLLNRPNIHAVPSKPKSTVPYAPTSLYEPEERKGPPPEEVALKVERLVLAASLPPTFERLRRALRVSKMVLTPVIDDLVENNKICVVEVGDVILYKPPRIEPIRRRRREENVAAGPRS